MASKITNVKFTATLRIPIIQQVLIYADKSTSLQEKRFIEARDKATAHDQKVCLDRARALIKWAECSNGKITEIHNIHNAVNNYRNAIEFTFEFSSYDSFTDFMANLETCVEGATLQ